QALVVDPAPLERHVVADDLHDVRAIADLGDLVLRDQPQAKALVIFTLWRSEGRDPRGQTSPVKEKAPARRPSTPYYGRGPRASQIGRSLFGNKIEGCGVSPKIQARAEPKILTGTPPGVKLGHAARTPCHATKTLARPAARPRDH